MTEPKRKRTSQLWLGIAIAVVLLFVADQVFGKQKQDTPRGSNAVQAPASATPAVPSQQSPPSITGNSPTTAPTNPPVVGPSIALNANQQTAVDFAATVINLLATATLKPSAEADQLVNYLAAPQQRAALKVQLQNAGPLYAQQWGYKSVDDAQTYAAYSVGLQMYHFDQLTTSSATISVFTVTHWISADNSEYRVPAISTVTLERAGGKWLYVKMDRSATNQPDPQKGLSYEQTVKRFAPYLKGYQNYVSGNE